MGREARRLVRDGDLLELGERLRLLISAGESCEPTSEGERLRRLAGLTDRELLERDRSRRRRRGGVLERDRDTLGAGELVFSLGMADSGLGNLLLSAPGDHDASLRRLCLGRGDGERLERRGDLERSDEGERRVRRRGGVRERSVDGERRARRGGGDLERLSETGRRRSRERSRRPRSRPRPPFGT